MKTKPLHLLRTERTIWHVEWNGPDKEPCMVASDVSAVDAKKQASKYFGIYSRATTYRLVEIVERRTTVERFKALTRQRADERMR